MSGHWRDFIKIEGGVRKWSENNFQQCEHPICFFYCEFQIDDSMAAFLYRASVLLFLIRMLSNKILFSFVLLKWGYSLN